MKDFKNFFSFFVVLFFFSLNGCALNPSQEQLQNADYGPYPSNYEEIIKSHYGKKLFDPYSANYTFNNTS